MYNNSHIIKCLVNKILALLFFLVVLFSTYAQNGGIKINLPKDTRAGNEFIAIISIPENMLAGIARIDIKLPNGFDAKAKKNENATFKFADQKASFQWLKYPDNKYIEISFSVTVAPTVEGYFIIRGQASYINNNQPVKFDIMPSVITVLPGDMTEIEIIKQQEQTKIEYDYFKSEGIACIRQVPYIDNNEIIVNVLVSKGDLNKYGKIQEKIPVGYTAVNIKGQNAIFVFNPKQNIVKYMWMNMPDKPKILVSYKLIPDNGNILNEPFIIYGTFSYTQNNITESIDIQERGINLNDN